MGRATAAALPVELHSRILESLNLRPHVLDDEKLEIQRRQLTRLSTVCKHWAYLCRPLILQCILFQSRQKIDQLVRLLRSPGLALHPKLQDLLFTEGMDTLKYRGSWSGFWIQAMSKHLPYYDGLRNLHCILSATSVSPSTASPLCPTNYAPRSWSVGLPRTLPPNFIRIHDLHLIGTTFRRADDFLSLLEGTRRLQRVTCTQITFAEQQSATPQRRLMIPRNIMPYALYVSGGESRDADLHIAMTAIQFSPRHWAPGHRLGEVRWTLVCDLFKSLMSFFWDRDHSIRLRALPLSGELRALDAGFTAPGTASSHGARIVWGTDPAVLEPEIPGAARVHAVLITFFGDNVPAGGPPGLEFIVKTLSWEAFEAAALALDMPGRVHITVTANPGAYAALLDVVDDENGPLSGLRQKGKLALSFDFSSCGMCLSPESVSLDELEAASAEHEVDGKEIQLDVRGRFELWGSKRRKMPKNIDICPIELITRLYAG